MTVTITGTVVDENGNGLDHLTVEARGDWLLTSEVIDTSLTETNGDFTLMLPGMVGQPNHPSVARIRVVDSVGRPICDDREVSGAGGDQDVGKITVRDVDRSGLLVTLGKGEAVMVSEGNAMQILIDGQEAFGHAAANIEAAATSINMTQLFFDTPKFKPDRPPEREHPALIFEFGPPKIVPQDPLPPSQQPDDEDDELGVLRPLDKRPERLLIDAKRRSVAIRVLLNKPVPSWPEGIFLLAAVPAAVAGLSVGTAALIGLVVGASLPLLPIALVAAAVVGAFEIYKVWRILDKGSHAEELRGYLQNGLDQLPSTPGSITVRGFEQPAPDNGVLHTKMVIVDGKRATVLGSPFEQAYFCDQAHRIDDPLRGHSTGDLFHDVSIGLAGPVVKHLHEAFRTYWNEDQTPGNQIPSLPPDPPGTPPEPPGPDGLVKTQVVRTLSANRFSGLDGISEKGILESYLRGFGAATRFIYLENQYFTDAIITEALITVLKAKTGLELIFMLNIAPDVLGYPGKQERLVRSLRKAAPGRVGIFTRWSYDHNHPRPWVAPVYLHSKCAVVDDTWATVGSANLDGLSLDHNVVLSPLTFGETTAAELNVTILGGTPGASQMAPAERIRRRLWAEHLGMLDSGGKPDPTDPRLAMSPTPAPMLPLWKQSAQQSLDHLKAGSPAARPGLILEYPADDGGSLTTPRKHLAALGVPLDLSAPKVRPVGVKRPFDFFTGRWGLHNREDFVGARREQP